MSDDDGELPPDYRGLRVLIPHAGPPSEARVIAAVARISRALGCEAPMISIVFGETILGARRRRLEAVRNEAARRQAMWAPGQLIATAGALAVLCAALDLALGELEVEDSRAAELRPLLAAIIAECRLIERAGERVDEEMQAAA